MTVRSQRIRTSFQRGYIRPSRRNEYGGRLTGSRRLATLWGMIQVVMAGASKSACFLTLVLTVMMTGCERSGGSKDPLRVGMDLTYPPFQMFREMKPGSETKPDELHRDIDGIMWEIDGVSVKLAGALAKDLGRPLKIVTMQFRDLIPALELGHIDLILTSMTITEKRRQRIDFSDPYVQTGLGMLVRDNSEIQSPDDLAKAGRRALVRPATSAEEFARTRMPNVKVELVQESGMGERTVMGDTEAAFINDQVLLLRVQKRLAARTRVLPKRLNEEFWGIGVRKGNDGLRLRVNAFLARFRSEGGFRRLAEAYLSNEQKFFTEQKLPPLFLTEAPKN